MLLPQVKPQDFVGVTYNGIRKVSIQDFERKPRPSLGNLTVQPGIGDSVLLAVTIYDIDLDEEIVYISWGYKRKSKGLDVPLFTLYSCQHNTSYAPPRLWEEIGNLPYPLVEPFQTIYRGPDISKDEVLHQPLFNHWRLCSYLEQSCRNGWKQCDKRRPGSWKGLTRTQNPRGVLQQKLPALEGFAW
jgi:hypothetical protein